MSAEILRQAAALMRGRANKARAGRWEAAGSDVAARWKSGPRPVALCSGSLPEGNVLNAKHIAAWDPAVALAVADWLDAAAGNAEAIGYDGEGQPGSSHAAALAVVRAYLGEDA